jgi:hypothetical protein
VKPCCPTRSRRPRSRRNKERQLRLPAKSISIRFLFARQPAVTEFRDALQDQKAVPHKRVLKFLLCFEIKTPQYLAVVTLACSAHAMS